MSAGQSAYEVARRQRDEAARLERSAALWEQGAVGEVAVAAALAALPAGWVVLHDLAWPGRQRANLDHVVIGPGGVFVVDAKNWSGRIEVRDHVLTQNGRRREEAVSSVTAAAIAVQALVSPLDCSAVLCFVRAEEVSATAWNVTVCSTANLVATLTSRPTLIGPDEVARCADAIRDGAVRPATPAPNGARPGRRSSKRRSRPVVALAGMSLLLAAVFTGGLQKAGEWVGQQYVGVIAPDESSDPAPVPKQRQKKDPARKKDRASKDAASGQS
jgi:hypothetical protein